MMRAGPHSEVYQRGVILCEKLVQGILLPLKRLRAVGRELAKTLAKYGKDGFGLLVPDGYEEIADQQARNLRTTAYSLSICGSNAIILVMAEFAGQAGAFGMLVASLILGVYATWVMMVYFCARRSWFMNASIVLLVVQGALWGWTVYRLAEVAVGQQSNFVIAIALGLISTPVLSSPFSVAIAFWIPVAVGGELAIAVGLHAADLHLSATVFGYELLVLVGIIAINRTLMQLSVARVELRIQNETVGLLLRDYEENASDWLWETDAFGRLYHVTKRFAQVLGLPAQDVEGHPIWEILSLDIGVSHECQPSDIYRALNSGGPFRDVPVKFCINGEDRWLSLTGHPLAEASKAFAGYRGVGSDITDAKRAAEATRYLATHDPLTGIGNRRMFIDSLEQACRNSSGTSARPFALLMLDLDRFKEVNDDHGHSAGDTVLLEAASRISRIMRQGDTVARLGGDEFALIMPNAGSREAALKADRLIQAISERIRVEEAWLSVGASIGIATFPRNARTLVEIMRNADLALYRAKGSGRGRYQLFEDSFGAEFQDRVALVTELRSAIDSEGVTIDYQPIVQLSSMKILSLEALCRWTHPVRGAIPPSVFIPLAEECGLIHALGRVILLEACQAAAGWNDGVSVSVNISPMQLKDPLLVTLVEDVLSKTKLDPARLEIEITESTWLKADTQTSQHVQSLSEIGVRIVLDDFGTGFSSLSTLRNFRFDGLKIDAEFVRNIETDPKSESILRLISAMATELGISLTAEGIETEGQLELVRAFGIAKAQGYLLGRPGRYTADIKGVPMPIISK